MRFFKLDISIKYYLLLLLLFQTYISVHCQSRSKADSFFYAGNDRLKSRWDFIDTATFGKSIRDYSQAINYKAEYWQAYRNRARIFVHQKKYELALQDLTNAIQNADKNSYSRLFEMRGYVFYELKMYREAIDDFHIALKDPQDKAKVLLYSAKAKWKTGHTKSACKDFNEAITLDKNLEKQKEFIKCEQK